MHGVQGKTGDPGFIAHWTFPVGISVDSKWLGYYVSLSCPRGFSRWLSHGLPDRDIIEGGPPKNITEAFEELFSTRLLLPRKPAPMHATQWDGPPDLGDHHGFLSRLGRSSAWSFHARDDRCGAPQPAARPKDLRSMSAALLSMRAAVAAAVPAVGDAPADEACCADASQLCEACTTLRRCSNCSWGLQR